MGTAGNLAKKKVDLSTVCTTGCPGKSGCFLSEHSPYLLCHFLLLFVLLQALYVFIFFQYGRLLFLQRFLDGFDKGFFLDILLILILILFCFVVNLDDLVIGNLSRAI